MTLAQRKAKLRQEQRQRLRGLDASARRAASEAIRSKILAWAPFQEAPSVFFFVGRWDEPDTLPLIGELRARKMVFVPRVEGGRIVPVRVSERTSFVEGACGILEPVGEEGGPLPDRVIFFVPGLAFDRKGGRLGRGEGMFDAFLRARAGWKIGVGFSFQLVEEVPAGPEDVPLDGVVTDAASWYPKDDG